MTLNDMYGEMLPTLLADMNIVEVKHHTNATTGELYAIELKCVPKNAPIEPLKPQVRSSERAPW